MTGLGMAMDSGKVKNPMGNIGHRIHDVSGNGAGRAQVIVPGHYNSLRTDDGSEKDRLMGIGRCDGLHTGDRSGTGNG